MPNKVFDFLKLPLNFIRGIETDDFRKRKKVDFPASSKFNFLCFSWLTDWILLKSHHEISDDEFPQIDLVDKDFSKIDTLGHFLDSPTKLSGEGLFGRLNVALYLTYWRSFLMLILLGLIRDAMEFSNVLLLKSIINNMQNVSDGNTFISFLVAAALCILQFVDIFFDTHFFFYYYRMEIRIESTLGAIISKRTLFNTEIGNHSSGASDNGSSSEAANFLNLQLFDIENASWGLLALADLLLTPIRVGVIAVWMYYQVGNASATSTLIVGLITFLMCLFQIKSSSLVKLYLKKLDSRVVETRNILSNIRTLRLIRWVEYSREAILTSRTHELQICNKRAYLYAVSHWLGSVLPYVVSLITFILYLMDKAPDLSLDASIAIPLMHTITYLIRPLKHLSEHLADYLSGIASIRRISKYLNMDGNLSPNFSSGENNSCKENKFGQKLVDLVDNRGLCVIIGQGGNKAKFVTKLQAELKRLNRPHILTNSNPWLPSGTIQSVITFFRPFKEEIYKKIISVCKLDEDFSDWEDGDLRTIDEGGTSLSTGQRARIALARLLYYQMLIQLDNGAPVVQVIDDVFSVLDPGVSGQVFWSIFSNYGTLNKIGGFVIMDEKTVKYIYQVKPSDFRLNIYNYELDLVSLETIISVIPTTKYPNLAIPNNLMDYCDSTVNSPKSSIIETPRKKLKTHSVISENDTNTPQLPLLQRYGWYLRHVGYFPFSILVFCTISSAIAHVISDFIIGRWSSNYDGDNHIYLYMFTLFTSLTIAFDLCKCFYQAMGNISGAKNTYESSVSGVLSSPMKLYDSMPIGRIINRLSTDQNYVDQSLFHRFCEVISAVSSIILVLISLCYLNPVCIAIFPVFSLLVYWWVFRHYMGINKEVMKRTLCKRSPFCTICSQCIDGRSTLKFFSVEQSMYEKYLDSLWEYQRMRFVKLSSASWALLRLRLLSLPLEFASAALPLFQKKASKSLMEIDQAPRVGLALSYSFAFAKLTRQFIHTVVQLETEMCCASRLQELSLCSANQDVPCGQTEEFTTSHQELVIKFPESDDAASIHTLSNDFKNVYEFSRGHYGIVGRTGAGKSTLLNCISGILPFDGKILLDGIDIAKLGNKVMSRVVGVIPHEMPILIGWSIRNYVNPKGIHPDYLIYDSLYKSGLGDFIRKRNCQDPLSMVIMGADGAVDKSIFTPLVIQHLSLARLILHSKFLRIVLVDEPRHSSKSNLPPIGQLIRDYLPQCSTFIIAHHIASLETCASIFLVDQGRIVKSLPKYQISTQQDLANFIGLL